MRKMIPFIFIKIKLKEEKNALMFEKCCMFNTLHKIMPEREREK